MIKRRYILGIDGLRAIAVIGVILYHLAPKWVPGGYLGVPLFFVISGYLMTDILLNEWESRKKIDIKNFYKKRMARVYPSLITLLLITGSVFPFIKQKYLLNFRQILGSSLLNFNNWWQIKNGLSYFEQFSNESPFTHLWSLSIEAQFYILWPIILPILLYKVKDYKKINYGVIGVTILSGILMAVMYSPEEINRVYYGTDTRLFSIMMGVSLAFMLRIYEQKLKNMKQTKKLVIFLSSLILVIVCLAIFRDSNGFIYRGGMFTYSLIAAICLGMIVNVPKFSASLSNPFIKWIGSRSYEIYLWQLPVIVVYNDQVKWNGENTFYHVLVQLIIILVLSEITYRIVRGLKTKRKNKKVSQTKKITKNILVVAIILLVPFSYGFVVAPTGKTEDAAKLQAQLEKNKELLEKQNQEDAKNEASSETKVSKSQKDDDELVEGSMLTKGQQRQAAEMNMTAIGDSVLLSAAPSFKEIFPKSYIEADVGRQLMDSEPVFKEVEKEEKMGDVVLVVLGTNGSFTDNDIDKIMAPIGNKPVFFVNTLVDRPWQKGVNDELINTEYRYENAHLINWHDYAQGQESWFEEDGVHMVPEGSKIFSEYVAQQILTTLDEKKLTLNSLG